MKLKSLSSYICFLIVFNLFNATQAEDQIDIWNKKQKENLEINNKKDIENSTLNNNLKINSAPNSSDLIKIEETIKENSEETKIFGIYDPAKNDFNINMWSNTNADDIRSAIKRINKTANFKVIGITRL